MRVRVTHGSNEDCAMVVAKHWDHCLGHEVEEVNEHLQADFDLDAKLERIAVAAEQIASQLIGLNTTLRDILIEYQTAVAARR